MYVRIYVKSVKTTSLLVCINHIIRYRVSIYVFMRIYWHTDSKLHKTVRALTSSEEKLIHVVVVRFLLPSQTAPLFPRPGLPTDAHRYRPLFPTVARRPVCKTSTIGAARAGCVWAPARERATAVGAECARSPKSWRRPLFPSTLHLRPFHSIHSESKKQRSPRTIAARRIPAFSANHLLSVYNRLLVYGRQVRAEQLILVAVYGICVDITNA